MATIESAEIIKDMLDHDGIYPGDPKPNCIYMYKNTDGRWLFCVAYNAADIAGMYTSPFVRSTTVQRLWDNVAGITVMGRVFLQSGIPPHV